jgi:hypothetical protein
LEIYVFGKNKEKSSAPDAEAPPPESKGLESFDVQLQAPTSQQQAEHILAGCQSVARLPDGKEFLINLSEVVSVQALPGKVHVSPSLPALEKLAVRWCQALAAIPYKQLPRSQRPIVKLLQRLPAEPTGIFSVDRGRSLILDRTARALWPAMRASVEKTFASPPP